MAYSISLPPLSLSLGLDLKSVETGVPLPIFTSFVDASGLHLSDLYEVVIPARTLKHRKARQETLNTDESDRFARVVRVYDESIRVFGERERALRWLTRATERAEGRTPLQMLRTEIGGRIVDEMLVQIDEGIFV